MREVSIEQRATDVACQQRTFTPPNTYLILSHFGTCKCFNVETNVYRCVSWFSVSNIPRYFCFAFNHYRCITARWKGIPEGNLSGSNYIWMSKNLDTTVDGTSPTIKRSKNDISQDTGMSAAVGVPRIILRDNTKLNYVIRDDNILWYRNADIFIKPSLLYISSIKPSINTTTIFKLIVYGIELRVALSFFSHKIAFSDAMSLEKKDNSKLQECL